MPRFYVCSQLGREGTNFFSAFLSVSLPQIFMSVNNFMGLTRRMDSLRRRVSQPDSALITFVRLWSEMPEESGWEMANVLGRD